LSFFWLGCHFLFGVPSHSVRSRVSATSAPSFRDLQYSENCSPERLQTPKKSGKASSPKILRKLFEKTFIVTKLSKQMFGKILHIKNFEGENLWENRIQNTPLHGYWLQHSALYCNTLYHTATHCNTHCNTFLPSADARAVLHRRTHLSVRRDSFVCAQIN